MAEVDSTSTSGALNLTLQNNGLASLTALHTACVSLALGQLVESGSKPL